MTNKKGKAAPWIGLFIAGWLLAWPLIGCGVKGPPKPLWQRPIPRVADLAGVPGASWVDLTWSLSEPLGRKQAKHARFVIYGAKFSHEKGDCQGCPRVFEKMAAIGYVDRNDDRYEARVRLEADYHYLFKVNLVTDGGTGADSDVVQIDGWSQAPVKDSQEP